MTYKNTIVSLVALASVGFAIWITFLSSYHPRVVSDAERTVVPDAFMEDVTALILDDYGKPSMKIKAPRMEHFTKDDMSLLVMPHLTIYRKSPQPWYVTSKHAKAMHGIEKVDFWDDVVVQHPADPGNPATIIKTPTLTVYPGEQTAETSDHITMIQPGIVVNSTGMHADMNTGNIKLLSQAWGEYVPNS